MQNQPSIVQNIGGDQNQVVGGNIIHGDAHIHLHGDTHQHQPPGGQERVESYSFLDPEVEDMLTSLNLMSLQNIFREEELTMEDLSKMTRDDLKGLIGLKKIKHRISIMEEIYRRKTTKELEKWKLYRRNSSKERWKKKL